ncbi:hypothetical protein BDY24DRAFT_31987 [Mrakia frigida]|uniref:uncharacterized protein n=1 Tax=Mrakia frigida TaxID=29902 RepID=UPI003FCC03D2
MILYHHLFVFPPSFVLETLFFLCPSRLVGAHPPGSLPLLPQSLLTSLLHHTTSFYASHPSKVSTSNPTTPILTDAHPPTTTTPFISPSVALIDEKAHQPFSRNRQKRRSMWMELDGDSLIALGILMEEHILHLLTTSGYAPPSPSSQPPIHPSPSPSPSPSPPPAPATVSFSLPPPSTSTSTARLPSSPPPSSSGEDAPGASNGKRPRKNPKKPSYRRVGARPLSEVLKPKATERVETEKERKERERRKRVAPEAGSGWKEREEEAGFFGTVRRAKRVRVSRKVGGEKGEKEREEREERERERAEEKGSGEEREEFERRVLGLGQKKQGKKVVVDSP